ncbi:hypothetical protein E3J79_01375 [Candidatus Dependentiae bacterium]|nr:MAG: hypothetical protein E3J79_01375 [Candidatus Dependentiae bacterium]
MRLAQLYVAFNQSLQWNAAFYFLYKILFTSVSFMLFYRLPTADFCIWANINSFIFLLLLWLDCGLRKSIPRYCPEFEHNDYALAPFLSYILTVQTVILIAAIPIFLLITNLFFHSVSLSCSSILLFCGAALFLMEGINSSIKLFYHAHFWNKMYTIIQSIVLFFEMGISIICILTIKINSQLLLVLFVTKLLSSSTTACTSFIILRHRYNQQIKTEKKGKLHMKVKAFICHSGVMWFSTIIKSLTERNFLVPFITHVISPAAANLFKIANDSAMLIHRPIIKTIGSSDTVLLAHLEANHHSISIQIIRYLLKGIMIICLPFCAFLPVILLYITPPAMCFFLIISLGHIIETILSPFERVLEVKRTYKKLIFSYIPYLTILIGVAYYFSLPSANLVTALIYIYIARITGSLLMVYFVYTAYYPSMYIKPAVANQRS